MLHRLLCLTLSVLLAWNPVAYAAPTISADDIVQFVQQSKIDTKELTLKELITNIKGTLPPKMEAEWQMLVKLYPNARLPKITIKRVKNASGREVVQLIAEGKQSGVLTIDPQGESFGRIDTAVNGRAVSFKLTSQMLAMGPQVFIPPKPSSSPKSWIFNAQSWKALSPKEKMKYWRNIHELLVKVENVQNAFQKSSEVKTSSLFFETAWAAAGDPCIVAGYLSQYDSKYAGFCRAPKDVISYPNPETAVVTCNPDFFPNSVIQLKVIQGQKPVSLANVTKTCAESAAAAKAENYADLVMKDQGRYLDAHMQKARNYCQQSGLTADQKATCGALEAHLQKVTGYCAELQKTHTQEKFYCSAEEIKAAEEQAKLAVKTTDSVVKTADGEVVTTTTAAAPMTTSSRSDSYSDSDGSSSSTSEWGNKLFKFLGSPFFLIPFFGIVGMLIWSSAMKSQMNSYYQGVAPQPTNIAPTNYIPPSFGIQ